MPLRAIATSVRAARPSAVAAEAAPSPRPRAACRSRNSQTLDGGNFGAPPVMLAGGGIKGGMIYGTSNATASEPDPDAVGPEDLATTVYHQLGIVADKELMAPGDRPIEICDGGKLLKGLLS